MPTRIGAAPARRGLNHAHVIWPSNSDSQPAPPTRPSTTPFRPASCGLTLLGMKPWARGEGSSRPTGPTLVSMTSHQESRAMRLRSRPAMSSSPLSDGRIRGRPHRTTTASSYTGPTARWLRQQTRCNRSRTFPRNCCTTRRARTGPTAWPSGATAASPSSSICSPATGSRWRTTRPRPPWGRPPILPTRERSRSVRSPSLPRTISSATARSALPLTAGSSRTSWPPHAPRRRTTPTASVAPARQPHTSAAPPPSWPLKIHRSIRPSSSRLLSGSTCSRSGAPRRTHRATPHVVGAAGDTLTAQGSRPTAPAREG